MTAVVFTDGDARLGIEAGILELGDELLFRQEALRSPRELREHEALARYRLRFGFERVAGEGEHEQRSAWSRDSGCFRDCAPKRDAGIGKVPDPVRNDEVGAARRHRETIHRRLHEPQPARVSLRLGAGSGREEHRQ